MAKIHVIKVLKTKKELYQWVLKLFVLPCIMKLFNNLGYPEELINYNLPKRRNMILSHPKSFTTQL